MNRESLLLLCLNFAFIAVLPRIFFKKGGFNLMWFVTAFPLFLAPVTAILIYFGYAHSLHMPTLTLLAVVLNACSIALIALTIGSNRVPLALWHQHDDAPQNIVTWGAYKRVRHPFYASFLLALVAAVVLAPHIVTILTFVYGVTILNLTAAREEKRLSSSAFGEEYRAYMRRTGRFVPKWGADA